MRGNSIFSFLVPKESKFFPMIIMEGEYCYEAARLLTAFFEQCADHEKTKEMYARIKEIEMKGDRLVEEIYSELNDTFITPYDREDIHDLCENLDDVLDYITSSTKRVMMFQPHHIPKRMFGMADNIQQGCEAINKVLKQLNGVNKHSDKALEQCNKLHELEHAADDLYEQFITDIFVEYADDSVELIKLKEIMYELEKATDKANNVGKSVKSIIVKYA